MSEQLLNETDTKMNKTIDALKKDYSAVRTGKASSSLVENIIVEYYGSNTPLSNLATISVPEAQLIVIQPWDKESIISIEKGLQKSDMGFNPANDGSVIRIPIPPLTEERRKELVKIVKKQSEDYKISIRNVRRDFVDQIKNLEKNKEISQDELHKYQEQIQKTTDKHIGEIDNITVQKEKEIMEI